MFALTQPESKLKPGLLFAAGIALVLTAAGTFGFLNGNKDGGSIGEYAINVAVVVVATLIIWLWISRWILPTSASQAAFRTLVLGVLTLISVPAFWLGLHPMFAVATLLMAAATRILDTQGSQNIKVTAALLLAAVGFVLGTSGNLFG